METVEIPILKAKDVMSFLRISKKTLLKWAREGRLRKFIGGRNIVRYYKSDILNIIKDKEVNTT